MSLVFYYAPWSTATAVQWALAELDVPHEAVRIDLQAKENRRPEFLAINPNGKVPVIVHDGTPIFESLAILFYLGETFGVERDLFPAPGLERAHAMQWMSWLQVTVGETVSRFLRNTSERVADTLKNASAGEEARAELHALLKILDDHLSGRAWVVGERMSLVDVHMAAWLVYFQAFSFDLAPYDHIRGLSARMMARPSAQKIRG